MLRLCVCVFVCLCAYVCVQEMCVCCVYICLSVSTRMRLLSYLEQLPPRLLQLLLFQQRCRTGHHYHRPAACGQHAQAQQRWRCERLPRRSAHAGPHNHPHSMCGFVCVCVRVRMCIYDEICVSPCLCGVCVCNVCVRNYDHANVFVMLFVRPAACLHGHLLAFIECSFSLTK